MCLAKPFDLIGKQVMIGGWFATKDWTQKNPALVKAFAQTIYQTAAWANKNQDKSAPILLKYTKIDEAIAKKMVRVTYAEKLTPEMIDSTLELAAKVGFTSRRVTAGEMIATV